MGNLIDCCLIYQTNDLELYSLKGIFRAKVVDSTKQSFIFELTGSSDKLNAFILLMKDLGLVEVARTGEVAISRGSLKIN